MTVTVDKYQDILDSRDILKRIEELESDLEDSVDDAEVCDLIHEELDPLKALAEEASAASDWKYGETLIRDSYFRDYAEELAEDIGAIDSNLAGRWPYTHIDWDAAADALKQDYQPVDFDGVTYWIRY
jgi:hypothetical protein